VILGTLEDHTVREIVLARRRVLDDQVSWR
jgi:hypothetical protein